jgi:hypothetical protein
MLTPEAWFFLFVIIGVVVRTILPWLKKKAENPETPFDPKFGYTAILGVILAYIEVAATLAEAPYALAELPTRLAILSGFFFGLGNNELCNRILHRAPREG